MLTITKEHIRRRRDERPGINPDAEVHLFGQEVNPETFAICKSDLFMKDPTGRDADHIAFGSTLSNGPARRPALRLPDRQSALRQGLEAGRGRGARRSTSGAPPGRFGAGTPRISDGQLLFLLHMLAHMKEPEDGGSRIAIIMNGSPLFTGDAGSGESEIRRWILENDWLEALIALPEQLFYNTGIATYVWVLTNRKPPERRGQGPADRRHRPVGADAQEPGRQAARDLRRAGRRRSWRSARARSRRRKRSQDLPDHALRLPQDPRRAAAAAQLPGQRRAHRPAGRRDAPSRTWRRAASGTRRSKRPRRPAGRHQQEAIRTMLAAPGRALFTEPEGRSEGAEAGGEGGRA